MARRSMRGFPDSSVSLNLPKVDALDLSGRRLVVVGGTDGLGRALATLAVSRGARVTVVGRTFRDEGTAGLDFVKADLSSMKEAQRVGETLAVEDVDAVLFTTGIIAAKTREVTAEGVERDMAISYLSRLAVLRGVAPRLGVARPSGSPAPRVFVMGFPGAGETGDVDDLNGERAYDAMKVHMNTVAGNEMLVLDGSARDSRVRYFGLNPGLIKTNIRANYLGEGSVTHRLSEFFIGLMMQTPERYAARVLPILFAPELESRTGVMFGSKGQPILPTEGLAGAPTRRYIEASEALVAKAIAGTLRG